MRTRANRFTLNARDFAELVDRFGAGFCQPEETGSGETVLRLRPDCGRGWIREAQPRPGLALGWGESCFAEDIAVHVDAFPDVRAFTIILDGEWSGHVPGSRHAFRQNRGEMALLTAPGLPITEQLVGRRPLRCFSVKVTPVFFRDWAERNAVRCRADGWPSCLVGDSACQFSRLRCDPWIRCAVEQVWQCPFQGLARQLALEARALDLLAGFIDGLETRVTPDGGALSPLRRSDVDKIRAAAAILKDELDEPPSLLELARRVGLNDFKLKRGFREVFDTTAFGYLRTQRMELARALLSAGELSVMAAAVRVGYTNASHFAAAYRRQFGCSPRGR